MGFDSTYVHILVLPHFPSQKGKKNTFFNYFFEDKNLKLHLFKICNFVLYVLTSKMVSYRFLKNSFSPTTSKNIYNMLI